MQTWIAAQEDAVVKSGIDANDWIAQTWAYDHPNVGDTRIDGKPVFAGDPARPLRTVKAKALLMSGQLGFYKPIEGGAAAAAAVPEGRFVTILSVQSQVAAAWGFKAADVEYINATVRDIMRAVAHR